MSGLVKGTDGRRRCAWGASTSDYIVYHDTEWGRPVRDDDALYERMTLEAFQSGLSWLTILRKREAFRAAFDGFDPERVAAYGDADTARLLADAGIVRNRAKVAATIDRGTVTSVSRTAITLRLASGGSVTLALDAGTRFKFHGVPSRRLLVRPGAQVAVTHTASAPATVVNVLKRAGA